MLQPLPPPALYAPCHLSGAIHSAPSVRRFGQEQGPAVVIFSQSHSLEQTLKQQMTLSNLSLPLITVKTTRELSMQLSQFKSTLSTAATGALQLILICDKTVLPCQELLAVVASLPTVRLIWISDAGNLADIPAAWLAPAASSSADASTAPPACPQPILQHVVGSQADERALASELQCVITLLVRSVTGRESTLASRHPWGQFIAAKWCPRPQLQQPEAAYHGWLTSTGTSSQLASTIKQAATASGILSEHWMPKIYSVCRELMSNAIYDATWAAGLSDYPAITKRELLHLKPEHWSRVWWGWNDQIFWLEVTDPFGLLAPESFVQHVAKATQVAQKNQVIDHKAQYGAGLGLFQVFTSSSAIMALSQPGSATSLIAIFQPHRHKPTFHNHPRSFHFFSGM